MPIGSCRRGITSLLGVSQVTPFCSGLCRTTSKNLRNQTNIINTMNLNLFAIREYWLENSLTKYYDSIKCDNVSYHRV
jgi:hypothetical protein